ncbi:MAG: type II toxin-antitoxin system antitoxin SocA domain-containing protein [Cyanobacteria bacterium P01_E01_bin.6]
MKTSLGVANRILEILMSNGIDTITHLKLQKLLYYVQAWSLVFVDKKIFDEDIEAWIHGPVIPKVYHFYKEYGYFNISQSRHQTHLTASEFYIVQLVCDLYGHLSPRYLEELTHSEFPWIKARRGLSPNQKSNRRISSVDMRKYYLSFIEQVDPPKISSDAVLKSKDKKFTPNRSTNFVSGISSVMDVFSDDEHLSSFCMNDFYNEISDWENLSSDWEGIGADINGIFEAIRTIDQNPKSPDERHKKP